MATKVQMVVGWNGLATNWTANRSALTWKRRLTFHDFAAAATTGNLDITGFPGGVEIRGAYIWLVQNFTGGGSGTATLSVGTTGTADAYLAATSVFSGALKAIVGKTIVPGTFLSSTGTGLGTVRVAMVGDVNTNLFTAGKADLYLILAAADLRLT